MADGSKTEKATPKKRRDERKKGNVFLSQDAVAVATLVGACVMLFALGGMIAEELSGYIAFCIEKCGTRGDTGQLLSDLFTRGVLTLLKCAFPGLLVTAL